MPLDSADLAALRGLLDQALDLDSAQVPAWLAALPPEHHDLAPQLSAMLADFRSPGHATFLADGPKLSHDDAEEAAFRAGDIVGAYTLVRQLGRGGMSTVWLAQKSDGAVKRPVARSRTRLWCSSWRARASF